MDKTREEKRLTFLRLLNINEANFQSFKHSSYLGTLKLEDTAQFTRLQKSLRSYLPADIIFVFPRKLSSPEIPVVEVYGLQKNKFKMDINELLLTARAGKDGRERPSIKFEFNLRGKSLFSELTAKNTNRPLAITIDDRVCTAPNVIGKIEGGVVEITGSFEKDEAKEIADILLTGHLPLTLTFISK